MRILSNLSVSGLLGLNSVADANTDTDKFLVLDSSGIVRYRTGSELYSDIGAGVAAYTSVLQHTVKAGVALTKGQAVYVTSADGTNMIVGKASNASEATSSKTLGLVVQNLALNAQGFVITEGLLAGLDTSTAVAGDPVWLGTDGNLLFGLANKPYAPAHLVFIGIVTRVQQNNGEIFVKVQNGFELQELHNVQITSTPSDNTVLAYEASTSLYKMKSIPTLLGYTPVTNARNITINGTTYDLSADRTWSVGTVTGTGTSNYLAKWQSGSAIDNSLLYDTSAAVLIGTQTAGSAKFMVYSTSADNHYQAVGSGPSFRFADTITSPNYTGIIALVTSSNQFITGAAAGDMVLANNTTSAIGSFIFGTGATERMRISPTGNVSINNTNNTYRFDVNGTVRFTGQLRLESTITNGTYTYTLPGATGTLALVGGAGVGTVTSIATTGPITGGTITSTGTIGITQASLSTDGYLSSTDWNTFNNKQNALTNPITGTGTSGQVAYFNGTSSITSNAAFAFTPTSQLLVNNSVTASGAIARGTNLTPTLTAAANNDVLVGLDINPTFTAGAFTGTSRYVLRTNAPYVSLQNPQVRFSSATTASAFELVRFSGTTESHKFQFITGYTGPQLELFAQSTSGGTYDVNVMSFFRNGNVVINSTADAGFRLDVNGTARVQGNTTLAGNSNSSSGVFSIAGTGGNNQQLSLGAVTFGVATGNSQSIRIQTPTINPSSGSSYYAGLDFNGSIISASGTYSGFVFGIRNAPASIAIASGSYYGIYSTALTAAANVWNLYMDGTANNHINGDLALGTTTFGTATKFTLGGSETASSAIARGQLLNTTLVAAANNDVLVGLDINPTFTNGAFTGVANYGLRIINPNGNFIYFNTGSTNATFSSFTTNVFGIDRRFASSSTAGATSASIGIWDGTRVNGFFGHSGSNANIGISVGGAQVGAWFATGNLFIGSSPTDAGYKLDVNGTARVQSFTTINAAPAVNAESALLVQPTTNNSASSAGLYGIYNNATVNTIASTSSFTGIYSRNSIGATLVQASGVQGDVNISAGTTTTAIGFTCNSAVTGTGTASTFVGYNFTDVFKSGSGAVTRQIGIRIMNLTAGGTANVGLLFNNAGNTSVNGTWDIYSQSGNNSYLAGSIGIGASTINASAKVQIDSANSGFLPPRQSQAQRTAIASPAEGLIVYQTDGTVGLYIYSGGSWKSLTMTTI